jgi:hypothetical protein
MATESVSIVIKAFDQTQKALRGIKRAFAGLSKVFFSFKTALVAAVGAGGLGLLISNALKSIDVLAKTSSRIGTTTDALSKLQYAGELAGIETNTLNMAMQRFVRRTAEAADGTGEAVSAFRKLRIDAEKLQKVPLDERMKVLAESFKNLGSEEEKLAVAFKLFDSEGTALINMLKQTGDEMDAVFREAEQLGLVLSEETAQGVEEANNAFTRLRALFRGTVLQITAAVAPALESLFTHLKQIKLEALAGTDGVEGFAKAIVEKFLSAVRSMIVGIAKIHTSFNNLLHDLNVAVFDFRRIFGLDGLDESEKDLKKKIFGINQALRSIESGDGRAGPAMSLLDRYGFDTVDEAKAELQRLIAEHQNVVATLQRPVKPNTPDYTDWIAEFDRLIAGIEQKTESVKSAMEEVTVTAQKPWYMPFINGVKMFGNSLDELVNEKLPDLKQMVDSFALQTMNNFTQAFVDGVTGAKSFGEAIKNLAKSVVDSLIKMLVQYYITKPLFDAISAGISSAFPTSSAGSGGGGVTSVTGALARGGVATGNNPYLVGEKGPEIFVPSTTGRVVPNNQLGSGGVTVVQNINVTTGVQQTVRAEIANLLPQISNAAKSAVADARLRGGGFSKAMVGA